MPFPSIPDLDDADVDVEFIKKFATSPNSTEVDRLGRTRRTLSGVEAYIGEQGILPSALAAQVGAEEARDGAVAAAESVGSFTTKVLAVAALAASQIPLNKGVYVTADNVDAAANDGFWVNRAGTLVRESKATLPAVAAEAYTPSWSGKVNGWPDRFFERLDLSNGACLGRTRMWRNTTGITFTDVWAKVTNSEFDGLALRNTNIGGLTNLCGPAILLDEIGAVEADTITVYVLLKPQGGNAFGPGRFASGVVGGLLGAQSNGVSATGTISIPNGSAAGWIRHQVVVPANAKIFALFPYVSAGAVDVVAIWAFKGTASDGPTWPTFGDDEALKIIAAQASASTAVVAADLASLSRVADQVTTGARTDSISVMLGATVANTEADGYTGFGEKFTTPSGFKTNACLIGGIPRGATTKKWEKIKVALRTHATDPAAAGATVVAVGEIKVDPDTAPLGPMSVPWRDPVTNALKDVDGDTELLAQYGVMFQAWVDDSVKATAGQQRASSITGATALTSYYVTTENARTGLWLPYAGNPLFAIAAVHFDSISQALQSVLSDGAKADLVGSLEIQKPLHYADLGRLRRTRSMAWRRMQPSPETGLRIVTAWLGDSWSWWEGYYLQRLSRSLIAKLGDGGVGWVGFGINGATMGLDARGLYFLDSALTNWTANYHNGSTSPNISDARSSTAGASIKIASISGATHPALSAAKLHFTGTADGVARWRWNGGAWSVNTNVQGGVGVQQTLDLTGFPTGALNVSPIRAITLELQVVSGSVILCGADFQSATDGIVFHKLGSSGSKASDWLLSMGAQYRAGFAALGCTMANILLMTNDQAAAVPPATGAAQVGMVASQIQTAVPGIDFMITVPPENPAGYPTLMSDYAKALRAQAANSRAAFLDLQEAFGDASNPGEYALGGIVPLFRDDAHMNDAGSGIAVGEFERSILWR